MALDLPHGVHVDHIVLALGDSPARDPEQLDPQREEAPAGLDLVPVVIFWTGGNANVREVSLKRCLHL